MNLLKDISSLSDEELKSIELSLKGFDEEPVDIETFIFDEYYLGNYYKGIKFSPHWIDFLNNLYEYKLEAPAFLIVLRGSIGRSKTTTACLGALYDLYLLSCLTTPQDYFGLVSTEQIVLFIMNITLGLSEQVAAGKINSMMETSPYFSELKKIAKENKLKTTLPKSIDIRIGSRVTHTLGQAIHCLSDNTRIPLLDGRTLSIQEIYNEYHSGVDSLYTYSLDTVNKSTVPGKITNVFDNGIQPVYRVTLDNGESFECTENHRLLGRDNEYHLLKDLIINDSLMPFNRFDNNYGYDQWENPYNREIDGTHRIVNRFFNGEIPNSCVTHHKDFNKKNNNPDNLITMGKKKHIEYHAEYSKEMWNFLKDNKPEVYKKMIENGISGMKKFWSDLYENDPEKYKELKTKFSLSGVASRMEFKKRDPDGYKKYCLEIGKKHSDWFNSLPEEVKKLERLRLGKVLQDSRLNNPEKFSEACKKGWETRKRDPEFMENLHNRLSNNFTGMWKNETPEERELHISRLSESHRRRLAEDKELKKRNDLHLAQARYEFHNDPKYAESRRLAVYKSQRSNAVRREYRRYKSGLDIRWMPSYYKYFKDLSELEDLVKSHNHVITKIEYIGNKHVYDLEIDKYHNFALECGVYSHNSALISEAAFSIYNDQFMSAFNSILARQQSRFLNNGRSSGRIWVDSSEKDTGSILNSLCERYRDKPGVVIDSGPLWEIRPWNYGTEAEGNICKFFNVYKGSEREAANIIDDDNEILRLSEEEPGSILVVPETHRLAFEADLDRSLRDLGGIATASKFRLFRNIRSLYAAFGYMPLFDDVLKLEFSNDEDQIINYCKLPQYFLNIPYKNSPRYIHVDIGVTGDKFGFAMSFISGKKTIECHDNEADVRGINTTDSAITTITELAFSIQNKQGQQVPIHKVRMFIKWLLEHRIPIAAVSADSFQSTSFLQEMKLLGLETNIISVDRSIDPYLNLRNSIYEGRVQLPDNKLLRRELENLEVNPAGDKVDHPDEFLGTNERGSKDCADAVAASVFNCFSNQNKYSIFDILYSDTVNNEIAASNVESNPVPGREAMTDIYNQWHSLPDPKDDPYYEYLKSLEEMNDTGNKGNVYNMMFRR